jgi:S-DNA-T family DNA segregation ATPase FtsK/SpoIIIE
MSTPPQGREAGGCGELPAPTGPTPDDPVCEGRLLTDLENEYIAKHFALAGKDVVRRQPSRVARRTAEVARVARAVARRAGAVALRAGVVVLRVTASVWASDGVARARSVLAYRVRKAPRDLVRLIWFALRGHARWVAMAWTFFTYGDLRGDARAARLAGDSKVRREAQELIRADSRARWARFAMFVEHLGRGALALGVAALLLWLLDSMIPRNQMWPWLAALYELLAMLWTVAIVVVPILATLVPVSWLVAAVYAGRDKSPGAGFLVRPDRDDADSWVDERMISQALAHLGISPLDKFFKDGGQLVYTVPARLDGKGTYAQVRLPLGVTADMVADRRDRLAANLGRAKLETWPTEGAEAGQLDLWVADKGKLGQGAGPWPLLHDGEVDIFEGVPFGRSQRGQLVTAPIMERNYLIGGRPGQGKSSAARTLCLGCVLDPTVELRVYVFASNPDFDPFAPRLAAYIKGDDDEAIEAGLGELRWLREEVTRRGKLLERFGAAKVTRKLATTVKDLHPIVVVFDECHELFEHDNYGGEAGSLAIKVVKKARKCGITLIFLTQSPTATSIPKDLTRNCSNGVAFSVADQVANDGLLGTGKYRQGIRATELRPGDDRGTAVTVGLTENQFELVNTFYVPFDEDRDEVSPVIARAMALLEENGLSVPAARHEADDESEPADHLADIHAVVRGETRVRTQLVLRRLAELNPQEYEGWSFQDLSEALGEHGLSARKYNGTMVVRSAEVARALTLRDEDEGDGDV